MTKFLKLGQIDDYRVVEPGETLVFRKETRRMIRLDFNVAGPAKLYAVNPGSKKPSIFLADLDGLTIVEFVWQGPLALQVAHAADTQVLLFTNEGGDYVAIDGETTTSFAKMHTAPTRNYAQELIEYQRRLREEQFRAEMVAEFDRRLAANPGVHPVTGEVIDEKPADDKPASTDPAADGSGGDDKDAGGGKPADKSAKPAAEPNAK